MSHNATTLSSWVRCIKAALDMRDLDSLALFEKAGLDPHSLNDPNARYPQAGITALWRLAVQASGDEAFGLSVGRQVNQTTFHALGYSLLASPSLEECFGRLLRYFRIVSDAAELDFKALPGDQYKFFMHPLPGDGRPSDEAIDALMSVLIRLCRALAGKEFRAQEITLLRPPPRDPALWQKVFKAPIHFQAEENAILFKGCDLRTALPFANPELARHNDAILTRYLAHFDKENTANRVHASLVEMLPLGEPSQEKVAEC
ncbi:MAG: AraC family transcriptional regulator, partial [Nevskiales bacterium]